MEPRQTRKAADTARSVQIGQKRLATHIFRKWRQARIALCTPAAAATSGKGWG